MAVVGLRITITTNSDAEAFDQSAYIGMARAVSDAPYPGYTDGTRNSLFPWLVTRFLDPQDAAFFSKGKQFNVLLGVLGTAALGLFFAFRMGPLAAFNTTALAGLAVLLPVSTFFGAEALFYVLFLFVCVCAMRLLNANPPWLFALLGLLAGLTWLAKPSATIFLGLFACFCGLRLLLTRWVRLPWPLAAPDWSVRRFFLGAALCGVLYGALIAPRLIHAQRSWGSATYSLPAFWFWADDWDTCTKIYYDCRREVLAKLPPHLQPSLSGYFRRHTFADALERAKTGSLVRLQQFLDPQVNKEGRRFTEKKGRPRRVVLPDRGFYLIGLFALAVVLTGCVVARGATARIGPIGLPLLLGLSAFAAYTVAMGWYLPTGPGHRFIMTLFLPTLWILAQGADHLRTSADSRVANGIFLGAQAILCALLVWRLADLLTGPAFEKVSYAF